MADPVHVVHNDDEITGKRQRNEPDWTVNKQKRLKAEGKEYVSSRKKVVSERKTGEKCRCKRNCLDNLSAETKATILQRFNEMGDRNLQDVYLAGGIQVNTIKRRHPAKEGSTEQRSFQFGYIISTGADNNIKTCREAYASLHGIGATRIRRISQAAANGNTPKDRRGLHNNRPRAINAELKAKIHAHIKQFPYEESHYGRKRTKKRYLNAELSVRKMYTLFLEQEFPAAFRQINEGCKPEKVDCIISYEFYFKYFKTHFNYGFGKPRTDVCGICEELKVKIGSEKNKEIRQTLQDKLQIHKRKAGLYYENLRKSTEKSKTTEDHETLCFDFEQNIPFPHLPVGEVFYKRQLWFFNFGIHSCTTGKPVMYTWPECTARRGCNEVISCLQHYMENTLPRTVKHLTLFCDGCRGQNQNYAMIRFLFTLAYTKRFDTITINFPIRGHSFLPCDREFGVIERMKRKKDTVQMYTGWEAMIRSQFDVVAVEGNMIRDYKNHFTPMFKGSVTRNGERFKVTEYKKFKFSAEDKYSVTVSKNMSGLIESSFTLLKANARPSFPVAPLYTSMVPVKKAKLDDVKTLYKYLNEETVAYINSIPEKTTGDDSDEDN